MSNLPEIHARLTQRPDPAPQVAFLDMLTDILRTRHMVHGSHGIGTAPQPVLSGVFRDLAGDE